MVLTVIWTVCALAIALGVAKEAWRERRRARRFVQGIQDGPPHFKWISRRFHRW